MYRDRDTRFGKEGKQPTMFNQLIASEKQMEWGTSPEFPGPEIRIVQPTPISLDPFFQKARIFIERISLNSTT